MALQCDVSKAEAAVRLVQRVHREFGRIDALINGAGPYHRVSLLQETNTGWHDMFDNNLHPVFYLTQAVVPIMKAQKWGRIVSFTMANAEQLIAQPQLTAHYIAKVGLLALSRSYAKLIAPDGITMNCVAPGFYRLRQRAQGRTRADGEDDSRRLCRQRRRRGIRSALSALRRSALRQWREYSVERRLGSLK